MEPLAGFQAAIVAGILALPAFAMGTLGKLIAIRQPYTVTPGLVLADLVVADFGGYGAIVQSAVPTTYLDPGTGDTIILLSAAGPGWVFTTMGTANLPQMIYGYGLTNAAGSALVAVTDPLVTPILLNASGQGFDAGVLGFRVTPFSVSSLQVA